MKAISDETVAETCAGGEHSLTVLIRTQGRRNGRLEEALVCLAAQDHVPAEVLVMAHRMDAEYLAPLSDLVDWARAILKLNVHVHQVSFGQRGTPLAIGLEFATSCVVACLDDDDHVLGSWASTLLEAHSARPDQVVRIPIATRQVRQTADGAVYSDGPMMLPYPRTFSWLGHLEHNGTPIHGFAVPTVAVRTRGLTFDRSLPVVEDWDFLLAASLELGVRDTSVVGGIYNVNSENTRSGVATSHWLDAEARVRDRYWTELNVRLAQGEAVPPGLGQDVAGWVDRWGRRRAAQRARTAGGGPLERLSWYRARLFIAAQRAYANNAAGTQILIPPGSRRHGLLRRVHRAIGGFDDPLGL